MFNWFKNKNKITTTITKIGKESDSEEFLQEKAYAKSKLCPSCGYTTYKSGKPIPLPLNRINEGFGITKSSVYCGKCKECGTEWEVEF